MKYDVCMILDMIFLIFSLWFKLIHFESLCDVIIRQCHRLPIWFLTSDLTNQKQEPKELWLYEKECNSHCVQFIFGTLLHWAIFQYWSFLQNYLSNIYNPQAGGGGWWEGRWESREGGERNQEELIRRWRDGKWRRRSKQKRNKINNKAIHVQHLHNLSREAITFGYSISHM